MAWHAVCFYNGMSTKTVSRALAVVMMLLVVAAVTGAADGFARTTAHRIGFSVREVAMVSLAGPSTLRLDAEGMQEGALLLQYTTTNAAGAYRTISVQWRPGDRAPSGTSLRLEAQGVPSGCGRSGGEVVLTDRPAAVITGIPSCATGRGGAGATLRYRVSVDDVAQLRNGRPATVTLVFTIGDAVEDTAYRFPAGGVQ